MSTPYPKNLGRFTNLRFHLCGVMKKNQSTCLTLLVQYLEKHLFRKWWGKMVIFIPWPQKFTNSTHPRLVGNGKKKLTGKKSAESQTPVQKSKCFKGFLVSRFILHEISGATFSYTPGSLITRP